jgi:hypothetical protein
MMARVGVPHGTDLAHSQAHPVVNEVVRSHHLDHPPPLLVLVVEQTGSAEQVHPDKFRFKAGAKLSEVGLRSGTEGDPEDRSYLAGRGVQCLACLNKQWMSHRFRPCPRTALS